MDDPEDEDDILAQLTYVAGNPDVFDKETMVLVMKAAIAEILELRMLVGGLDTGADR